jgi:hypothetical protein
MPQIVPCYSRIVNINCNFNCDNIIKHIIDKIKKMDIINEYIKCYDVSKLIYDFL